MLHREDKERKARKREGINTGIKEEENRTRGNRY
jgi:hypothetical protein